ncbi:MAG: transcriptional repressor [Deltaproteobacteria bacterium]|nr:transcriptional repressor [bacterium]MCB9487616.1 transcriptional repressor [Deltaproteobacteria bacterium]
MEISTQEVEQRVSGFKEACRKAGVKLTHQRLEIFREMAQTVDHPDAESVYNSVRERVPTVSMDTVYRTLWMLNDLGLVKTLGQAHERTRFDANLKRHHHFVCVRCGLTRDFYSDELDELDVRAATRDVGQVVSTLVEVHGVCNECAQKEKKGL